MPETLRQRMSRGPIDPSVVLDILRELLETLAFDHWRGIVHGDIAPETIVLSRGCRPYFSGSQPSYVGNLDADPGDEDFEWTERHSTPGPTADTGAYKAPEQVGGGPADERSDIFALAVVAYEMFTGRHPFGASDGLPRAAVAQRIANEPPLGIAAETLAGLPRPVLAALDMAFAKNPANRFSDTVGFIEALKEAAPVAPELEQQPAFEQQQPVDFVMPGSPRRRLMWVGGLAVVVLALVVLALWFLLARDGDPVAGDPVATTAETTSTALSALVTTPIPTAASTTTSAIAPSTTTAAPITTTTASTTTTTVAMVRVEQTDPLFSFAGDWTTVSDDSASGGDFAFANSPGASITVTFEGTYLAWIAKRSPAYGKAEVTLDGKTLGVIDLYAATEGWQVKVWGSGNLKPGLHTVVISWIGTKNTAATDTNVGVDAFEVRGALVGSR